MQRPQPSADPKLLPQAQASAAALMALARAARSLVLYDASNAMVRHHLGEYHDKMCRALEAHGEMAITVTSFHLAVGGHIVLEDRDRERSFPSKLYRDGVRVLRILENAPWVELLGLLEIVAVRYAAVRQQEEDTVTLLRRADFQCIRVEAVEGFTEVEELPEPSVKVEVERAPRAQPPDGWDTPIQKLPAPAPVEFRPVSEDELAELSALAGETDEDATAALSIGLAEDLLAEATRTGWPMPNRDLAAFFAEVRDALLIDGKLAPLRQLVDVLAGAGVSDLRDQTLRALADARTLQLVLDQVPEDSDQLPPDLVPFLPLLGVGAALEALAGAHAEGRRQLLVKIVLARLPREADAVLDRIGTFAPPIVRELAAGLVARAPERAAELARRLLSSRSEDERLEALEVVAIAPVRIPLRPLCDLLQDRSEAVRIRAAAVLGTRGDESVFDALLAPLEGDKAVSSALAEAIGRSLASIAPLRAFELFTTWMEPKARFLVGLNARQRMCQWAAVAGSGELPGPGAEQALRSLAERSEGELRRYCLATLARRGKQGGANG